MTPIFNPLRDKAELLNTHAQPYQHAFDQIADTITFADLTPCPVCNSDNDIDYIQTANEPEHGTYGIAIGCTDCQIQTTGQHWFISSPHSALTALNAAIELWNRRPEQSISEDAEAVTSTEPVIASEARQSESSDQFKAATHPVTPSGDGVNPENYTLDVESGREVTDKGEHKKVIFECGGKTRFVTCTLVPEKKWESTKQDATRYQWLKARFHAAETYYGDGCINALIFAAPEDSGLTVDLDQTIDNSIAATQKPEAAK